MSPLPTMEGEGADLPALKVVARRYSYGQLLFVQKELGPLTADLVARKIWESRLMFALELSYGQIAFWYPWLRQRTFYSLFITFDTSGKLLEKFRGIYVVKWWFSVLLVKFQTFIYYTFSRTYLTIMDANIEVQVHTGLSNCTYYWCLQRPCVVLRHRYS